MVYKGAHNALLAETAASIRRRLAPFRRAQFHLEGRLPRSQAEHDAVVSATVRGDAAAAHAALLHHVTLVEQSFEELCAGQNRGPAQSEIIQPRLVAEGNRATNGADPPHQHNAATGKRDVAPVDPG